MDFKSFVLMICSLAVLIFLFSIIYNWLNLDSKLNAAIKQGERDMEKETDTIMGKQSRRGFKPSEWN